MRKLTISFFLMLMAFSISAQDTKFTATLNKATRLFGAKDDLTTVIMIIPSGEVVDILGSDSTYFHVVYQESEGYILRRHTTVNKTTASVVQQQTNVQEGQPVQQQQVNRFSWLENKYGTSMAARLIAGKIWKGMTTDMVQDSWGTPKKINRVISGNIVKEQWIYMNSWLLFENDTLSEWGPVNG